MRPFKKYLRILWVAISTCFLVHSGAAQSVFISCQGNADDSSFYHLTKVRENEYWAGGEYGILKKMDSTGEMSNIQYGNEGINILEIERYNDYVYMATDNAVIYRYDLRTGEVVKKEFQQFKNRCFYDLMVLSEDQLLVCGGHTGIADGLKRIPHGFVAHVNFESGKVEYTWKNVRKFAWSLAKDEQEHVYVSLFNGFNTKVKVTDSRNKHWKKVNKVKGLVHEIAFLNHELWYSGTRTMHYTKDGIIGKVSDGRKPVVLPGKGCLWSMDFVQGSVRAVTQSGHLITINPVNKEVKSMRIAQSYTLYDLEKISESKIILVGHGKGAYILEY